MTTARDERTSHAAPASLLLVGGGALAFAAAALAAGTSFAHATAIGALTAMFGWAVRALVTAPSTRAVERLESEVAALRAEAERHASLESSGAELMRIVVDEAPGATVLMSADGEILLANGRARVLFFDGEDLTGRNFLGMVSRAPEALRRAMTSSGDELFAIEDAEGEPRTFHLSRRHVEHRGSAAVLVTVNDVTRELGRREVEVWKQVIRVIAHEVHNSLAPISTLASTGRVLARGAENERKLETVFETVKERVAHLRDFLDGYAELSRLPLPKKQDVPLADLAARVEALWPGIRVQNEAGAGATASLDLGQTEQLLLNLLKNASEAGSAREDTVLAIDTRVEGVVRIAVRDRGHGMSADVMSRALLPLYSTKANGAGLGLALCREIVEAHGGVLGLQAREGGGIEVVIRLPRGGATAPPAGKSPLTLSRGG